VGLAALWSPLHAWEERQQAALRAAQLEAQLAEARLQALAAQLDPHFLFNALNTVSAVMYEDLGRTERLLSHLGQLLRAALAPGGPTWELAEECAHAGRYAELLQARFGDRLAVAWEVAPGLERARVPRFAIQTLIENAVKHNQERLAPLTVRVRAGCADGRLRIEVEDDGQGFGPAPASGRGLARLEETLRLLGGERAALERSASPSGGARVALTLPREEG
jgi:LytS/YehU family sensor histidine kinase